MKKLLLGLFFIFNCTNAIAEWVKLGSDPRGIDIYRSSLTAQVDGKKVKMWSRLDYQTALYYGSELYNSVKQLIEYDCEVGKSKNLWLTLTKGSLGEGDVVFNQSVILGNDWKPIAHDFVKDTLFSFACKNIEKDDAVLNQTDADISLPLSIEEAKAKCTDLGFKAKTEAFGKCVLKLSN
jgi:hypothetical protein